MSSNFELMPHFYLSWWEWGFAILAALLVGVSKGGVKGIGIVFVTLMALAVGGKASTGVLLPLLSIGDIIAVYYYHRHTKWQYLYKLLPWMVVGVLIGVWAGKDMPEAIFKRGMAVIIILTVMMMYWWDKNKDRLSIPNNWWFAGLMGLGAGFTTMVGNLAGAFVNIYFLAMRLPKNEFIGTAAWLFLIINLFKLPFHLYIWNTIDKNTLLFDLKLSVFVILGVFLGIQLTKYIKEHHYRQMILILTALGAFLIFFK